MTGLHKAPVVISAEPSDLAEQIITRLNRKIVMGLPLGLGKANLIVNAIYQRALEDPKIDLTILSALTLMVPRGKSDLEKRFIDPVSERLFKGYPQPLYAAAMRSGAMPGNIKVHEFFLQAGQWLGVPLVQQNYISSNYTHAANTLLDRGMNVIAQMVSPGDGHYSLSCNTDMTLDLLSDRAANEAEFLLVGEVNPALPYMTGEAEIPIDTFDYLLQGPCCDYPLFSPPKPAVALADYAAGFRIAALIHDGGTLQIGIGSIGDGVAQALVMRQNSNKVFRDIVGALSTDSADVSEMQQLSSFDDGLFGVSEMLVDSFLPLIDAGVIKREVDGALIHGAFFLGPKDFYKRLHDMPTAERHKIQMKAVSWVNSLYGSEAEKRKTRSKARFINNAMMATLMGAVVSDGLEDGRVVSGVGGQYNFVAQAFELKGARSIITLNATRMSGNKVYSNILWKYGHQTIPRHLRDIVVTEYGVADLRNKTDAEVIAAMLSVADSRFQDELLAQARQSGKIPEDYKIPTAYRNNTPEKVRAALASFQQDGEIPEYPFGSDFSEVERQLIPALKQLKRVSGSKLKTLRHLFRGLRTNPQAYADCLQRMSLQQPASLTEWAYRGLLLDALSRPDQE
jgi:hypothetical protein